MLDPSYWRGSNNTFANYISQSAHKVSLSGHQVPRMSPNAMSLGDYLKGEVKVE